jgi:acetoin utilization deacetylase AcuC-like enzyme
MARAPVFLHHAASLAHDTGSHPERADRIRAIERELEARNWLGFERIESPPAELAQLTAVHPQSYVESIREVTNRGGGQLDLDTVVSAGSFAAALHAAGGAAHLVDLVLDGAVPTGFSAHRPPGHHALSDRAMGFCLFNNVAVAAQHALDTRELERVMIFDWDVHHGNGTNDIFHSRRDVLFVSVHQSPLYPGTGPAWDAGSGDGEGFTVNLPVPPGSGDDVYLSLVDHVLGPLVRAYQPQLMLVSAGYDAHAEDPLAECRVTEAGFAEMTRSISRICAELGVPYGFVLEGGYALDPLSRSVAATLEALSQPSGTRAQSAEPQPLSREALARLGRWWPELAD